MAGRGPFQAVGLAVLTANKGLPAVTCRPSGLDRARNFIATPGEAADLPSSAALPAIDLGPSDASGGGSPSVADERSYRTRMGRGQQSEGQRAG